MENVNPKRERVDVLINIGCYAKSLGVIAIVRADQLLQKQGSWKLCVFEVSSERDGERGGRVKWKKKRERRRVRNGKMDGKSEEVERKWKGRNGKKCERGKRNKRMRKIKKNEKDRKEWER
jgi:hypothetical protein